MLAFTFPGQGSQRPAWAAPGSTTRAGSSSTRRSTIADRDVGRLLLDADADELKDTRNAQLTHVRVQPDGARRRRAPRHRARASAPATASASTPRSTATGALGFDDGVRLVAERAEAMHDAGLDNPGTMAAVLGLDDDQVEVACRRADGDVWVANFNAPGQVVIAGSPDGVAAAAARRPRSSAPRRCMPLPVSGAFHTPFMAPARDRLRKAIAEADPRDTEVPVVVQRRRPPPRPAATSGPSLLSAQLSQPGALEAVPARRWPTPASPTSSSSARAACSPAWPSARSTGARTLSVATPDDLDKLLEFVADAGTPRPAGRIEGEHLFATERLVVSPAAGVFTPDRRTSADGDRDRGRRTCSATSASTRCARRSPGVLQSYIAVDGERVTLRQPIAWLRTA